VQVYLARSFLNSRQRRERREITVTVRGVFSVSSVISCSKRAFSIHRQEATEEKPKGHPLDYRRRVVPMFRRVVRRGPVGPAYL